MSELTVNRIAAHARRLGLRLIAEDAAELIQRASDAQLGYADFLDLALGEEAAAKEDRRFASALRQAACPTTRPSTTSTSPSSPASTPARSATSPPLPSPPASATSRSSARRGQGKHTWPAQLPYPRSPPGTQPTSPPSTTWSASSAPRTPPAS